MSFVSPVRISGLGANMPKNIPGRVNFSISKTRPAGKIIIQDTFSGSGSLGGTAPDTVNTPGGFWVETLGTWSRFLGNAVITGQTRSTSYKESGIPDVNITDELTISKGGGARGIVLRFLDDNNQWNIVLDGGSTTFRLIEIAAGVVTARASAGGLTTTNGDLVRFTTTANGQSISSILELITGSATYRLVYNLASFNETETKHGIISHVPSFDKHTNYKVETL